MTAPVGPVTASWLSKDWAEASGTLKRKAIAVRESLIREPVETRENGCFAAALAADPLDAGPVCNLGVSLSWRPHP